MNFGSNPENPGFPEAKTEGFGVAGEFLPRINLRGCRGHARSARDDYRSYRDGFYQLAGEMGSACVSHAASGVTPDAFGKCSQRDVANGDRDGRAPHHDVQHVQPRKLSSRTHSPFSFYVASVCSGSSVSVGSSEELSPGFILERGIVSGSATANRGHRAAVPRCRMPAVASSAAACPASRFSPRRRPRAPSSDYRNRPPNSR